MSEPQKPNPAREMLEKMHSDIRQILSALSIPAGETPRGAPPEDPSIQLLSSILTTMQDFQSSQEAMHRRLDAVVRSIPGASR